MLWGLIAGEVYQVSVEVAAELGATLAPKSAVSATTDSICEFLHQLPETPVLPDPEPGKVRLDVRLCNALQLHQLGIDLSQVALLLSVLILTRLAFFPTAAIDLKKSSGLEL